MSIRDPGGLKLREKILRMSKDRVGVLLRYNPKSRLFTGRVGAGATISPEATSFGGAKVTKRESGLTFLEMVDPSWEDFMKFAGALGGEDSRKALSGMASQVNGEDILVAILSIKQ